MPSRSTWHWNIHEIFFERPFANVSSALTCRDMTPVKKRKDTDDLTISLPCWGAGLSILLIEDLFFDLSIRWLCDPQNKLVYKMGSKSVAALSLTFRPPLAAVVRRGARRATVFSLSIEFLVSLSTRRAAIRKTFRYSAGWLSRVSEQSAVSESLLQSLPKCYYRCR
jgi:hypothetical protein